MTTKATTLTNSSLFEQFLKQKRYVENVSQNTLTFYSYSFKAFNLSALPTTQTALDNAIVSMRESGKSAACVNAYIRGLRPLLSFLFENGYLTEKIKLKKLKCEDKQMRTFSDAQIRAILSYKPQTKTEHRLLALLTLLTDTGIRINEALTLTRASVDFENRATVPSRCDADSPGVLRSIKQRRGFA